MMITVTLSQSAKKEKQAHFKNRLSECAVFINPQVMYLTESRDSVTARQCVTLEMSLLGPLFCVEPFCVLFLLRLIRDRNLLLFFFHLAGAAYAACAYI